MLSKIGLKIKKNHIFCAEHTTDSIENTNKGLLGVRFYTRESAMDEHTPTYGNILNPVFAQGANRVELLRKLQPETVLYSGLPGYKQIQMCKNYFQFIPLQYHSDELYKKPSEEVLEAEAKDQKRRKEYKKRKKEEKIVSGAK